MAMPLARNTEPLRRRFPHLPPPLLEVLEACLQVGRPAIAPPAASMERTSALDNMPLPPPMLLA
jgi:hypothetical protein